MNSRSMSSLAFAAGLTLAGSAVAGPQPKVDVCHPAGNSGQVLTLNVNANSLGGHLGHGDWLPVTFFEDADGDGFGDAASPVVACVQPAGTSTNAGDCDDDEVSTNPEAEEVCGDGIDNNCDNEVDEDCFETIEVTVGADNAYMIWIDGVRYFPTYQTDWAVADTVTVTLPIGNHTVAVYGEGWGVVEWVAASVRVDGQLISVTGDGNWRTEGPRVSTSHPLWWQRVAAWNSTGPLSTEPAGWTDVTFDDSAWAVAPLCSSPPFNLSASYPGLADLVNDGAQAIWVDSSCNTPYSPNSTTIGWEHGFFRLDF